MSGKLALKHRLDTWGADARAQARAEQLRGPHEQDCEGGCKPAMCATCKQLLNGCRVEDSECDSCWRVRVMA